MVHILSKEQSVISHYLTELRDHKIQSDSVRFRQNMRRLGNVFAYEISKTLSYKTIQVETPLGISTEKKVVDDLCLSVLLRAGLPIHQGMLDFFPYASNGFISANRHLHKHGALSVKLDYITMPDIDGKVLILCDAMIATGSSVAKTLEAILEESKPKAVHIVAAIASSDGISYLKRLYPNAAIWVAAMDEELTAKSYIVPGLGDAGNLSYGEK